MSEPVILATNDDGIDSAGFRRLVEALEPVGDVVGVAPAGNRSAVGRSIDAEVSVEEHPLGYVVEGTPASCVVSGITALGVDPDIVLSGINKGANLGAAILGRSGTVAAAIEAAYLGVPAIAVSMYIPFERIEGEFHDYRADPVQFAYAARSAAALTRGWLDGDAFDHIDYLSVNTPMADGADRPRTRITSPAGGYLTTAEAEGDRLVLRDRQFELLYTGDIDSGAETDRAAIADGDISVSPLRLPNQSIGTNEREAMAASIGPTLDRALAEVGGDGPRR